MSFSAKTFNDIALYWYLFVFLRKNSNISLYALLELAKRYNIKGADAIIEKVISVLGNYKQYAKTAGVSPYWTHKIKEEIGYRIDNMTHISYHRGLGR